MKGYGIRDAWSSADRRAAGLLLLLSAILLLSGVSSKSLHNPEERWAVIVREMIETGDYLTPTINAEPYYDKPLMSYWAVLPFAWLEGEVSERAVRFPSAVAGIALVLLAFAVGRRLFGRSAGIAGGALLATAAMFVFWSQTASADILNTLAVWTMIWCFLSGAAEGKAGWLVALYCTAAAGSFLKGPVAACAAFAGLGLWSAGEVVADLRRFGSSRAVLRDSVRRQFCWVLSPRAAGGILTGGIVFAVLLLGPAVLTGNGNLARLMYRENVVRFFEPFDHVEPVYAYVKHSMVFFAPWSLLFIAALWDSRSWPAGRERRGALLIAAGIFTFFTISGSRRDYYILPLLPAMAVITGHAVARWTDRERTAGDRHMTVAAACTAAFLAALSAGLGYLCIVPAGPPTGTGQGAAALLSGIGAAAAMGLLLNRTRKAAFACLLSTAFVLMFWGFTAGMFAAERMRTFRPFCRSAAKVLGHVPDEEIALYRTHGARLAFYIRRRGLARMNTPSEVEDFRTRHPHGYVFAEHRHLRGESLGGITLPEMAIVAEQKRSAAREREKCLVLLEFESPAEVTAEAPIPSPGKRRQEN